jgi:hypothetical protein
LEEVLLFALCRERPKVEKFSRQPGGETASPSRGPRFPFQNCFMSFSSSRGYTLSNYLLPSFSKVLPR